MLNIELNDPANVKIEVYDIQGRQVLADNFNNSQSASINLSGITPGQYFVRVLTDSFLEQIKIIKN